MSCFFREALVIALRRLNMGVFAELFHKDVGNIGKTPGTQAWLAR